jgi:UDP-N-acetylmuramoyl-tripeptide--D-alanyl-D-alanine ligase
MEFTAAQVVAATGGQLLAGAPTDFCDGAWHDSRSLPPQALFVPVRAQRDGHAFIADAVAAGAAGYLTADRHTHAATGFAVGVDDTVAALTRLGEVARERVDKVVAITGSNGKTTTKDLLGHVLSTTMTVGVAAGSLNNELGLPLTLCNAPEGAGCVVTEIGARCEGNIAAGVALARPDVGVVTNVGTAHIGVFGSQEAIARAKGELPAGLRRGTTAVLNADDERVAAMAAVTDASVITFGMTAGAEVRAEGLHVDADLAARFDLVTPSGRAKCRLPMSGTHLVSCALAAAAAAFVLGVDAETTAFALEDAERSSHRMQIVQAAGGWRVLNDAYNANPDSMAAAIRAAAHLAGPEGRALAVLGHMAELGDYARAAHTELRRLTSDAGFAAVVAVGELGELVSDVVAPDPETAAYLLRCCAGGFRPGDVVLVKGSRIVGLETAVPLLLADEHDTR